MTWECKKCGKCCTRFRIVVDADSFPRDSLFDIFGIPKSRLMFFEVRQRCQHLMENNLCRIQETKSDICRAFRCDKAEIMAQPGSGY